jgi:hypothetical protein
MSSRAAERPRAGLSRPERLLPYACLAAAIVLGASELETTFRLADPANATQCVQHGFDRHSYAQLLLATFGAFAAIAAVLSGSRPAARATAAAGVIALLLFFIIDLPHANNQGTVGGTCDTGAAELFATAKAVPQAGFWLELIGSLGLAVSGIALATLSPRQLQSLRPRWLVGSGTETKDDGGPRRRLLKPADNPGPKGSAKPRQRGRERRRPKRTGDAGRDEPAKEED